MCEKKFIPTDFTWLACTGTFRLLGFWADSNVWLSYDPLIDIKFSYVNLKTGKVREDVVRSSTHSEIKKTIEKELVKVFPKPIPKREIGLTVEEIGEIIREYSLKQRSYLTGADKAAIRLILTSKNLVPKNG